MLGLIIEIAKICEEIKSGRQNKLKRRLKTVQQDII